MGRGDAGGRLSAAREAVIAKLRECGSVELMANFAMLEAHRRHSMFGPPADPVAENPYLEYALGLFLSHNNMGSGEPDPKNLQDLVNLMCKYFGLFAIDMMKTDKKDKDGDDFLVYSSKSKKILDDLNPNKYDGQYVDYLERVFSPFDDYFYEKFGFSASDAITFATGLRGRMEKSINDRYASVLGAAFQAEARSADPGSKQLVEAYASQGMTKAEVIGRYVEHLVCQKSSDLFTIDAAEYCREQKITKTDEFYKFMDEFSCRPGGQIPEFVDPLSDNIIFSKPVIKLAPRTFFVPKADLLFSRLDIALERLLEDTSKREQDGVWDKFARSKSGYLEDKTYDLFARIFPKDCLYKSVTYTYDQKLLEVDLLVVYDNKIIVVEAKSGNVPLSAKQDGRAKMQRRLRKTLHKAVTQTDTAIDYMKSGGTAEFGRRGCKGTVVEINMSDADYEFYPISVTLEDLGSLTFVPRDALLPDCAKNKDRFWPVYLHDLDIITDMLSEPVFFIHYMESRVKIESENISMSFELDILGYYLQHGELSPVPGNDAGVILTGFMDQIDEHYIYSSPKPQLQIPEGVRKLLLNMQEYRQAGFTKISSALLDFPPKYKAEIGINLNRILRKISGGKKPKGFLVFCKEIDTCFMYMPSSNVDEFCRDMPGRHDTVRSIHGVGRSVIIVRDASDKENYATFLSYDQRQS